MPELLCCLVRISVWIHLSISVLIINKLLLSSQQKAFWETWAAKLMLSLIQPPSSKQKEEAALCDRLAVTSCLWLWIQKQNQGLQTSHDSISVRAHCVWLSAQCAYAARVPQYWEAAVADTAVTNDCWWRNKANQLSSLVPFASCVSVILQIFKLTLSPV